MPVQTSYPGIYIEELPSSAHTITAAPTSITVLSATLIRSRPIRPTSARRSRFSASPITNASLAAHMKAA